MMVKSLSVLLVFVIYCLLNIYESQLMSALPKRPIVNTRANVLLCTIQLYCSTAYKTLLTNQYWRCMPRKMSLKLLHYCTLLSMAHHFDTCNNNIASYFVIIQAVKLDEFTSKQYQRTTPLRHQFVQGYWLSSPRIGKLSSSTNNPSVTKDQGSEVIVLTSFHPVCDSAFNLSVLH